MRVASTLATLVAALALPASASAEGELQTPGATLLKNPGCVRKPAEAGMFDGLGPNRRFWEVSSEASLTSGQARVATEEVSLARLFCVSQTASVVARVGFGVDGDFSQSGVNSIQGLLPSIGARLTSPSQDSWIEVGLRLVAPWPSVRPGDPSGLALALQATLSSQTADDARWLTFASTGYQVYLSTQSRWVLPLRAPHRMAIGTRYGIVTSLLPLQIQTWLGPENGIVGDTFVDLFADVTKLLTFPVNLELGVRGEVSLSSIWPSTSALPVGFDGYLGWSPEPWLVLRAFGGYALSPVTPSAALVPYGLRAILYFDEQGRPSW